MKTASIVIAPFKRGREQALPLSGKEQRERERKRIGDQSIWWLLLSFMWEVNRGILFMQWTDWKLEFVTFFQICFTEIPLGEFIIDVTTFYIYGERGKWFPREITQCKTNKMNWGPEGRFVLHKSNLSGLSRYSKSRKRSTVYYLRHATREIVISGIVAISLPRRSLCYEHLTTWITLIVTLATVFIREKLICNKIKQNKKLSTSALYNWMHKCFKAILIAVFKIKEGT